MSQPVIRLMEMKDRDAIIEFYHNMAADSRMFFNRGRGNELSTLRFFDHTELKQKLHWVGDDDGRIAGYVFLYDTDTMIPWLGIAVAEYMRGKHFGEQLIRTAEKWARDNGKGGLLLTTHMANIRAQTLYERCGFRRLGVHSETNELLYLLRF